MTDSEPDSAGATFAAALAPISRGTFLSTHWNRSPLRLPGTPGKFTPLLSWAHLNLILEQHRFTADRLRLVRGGSVIQAAMYLKPERGHLTLDAAAVTTCLADGATLVLNGVDELSPRVRAFAESVDEFLGAGSHTWANIYASWCIQAGFGLHWDDQDATVLQLAGRKRWQVYAPTLDAPLRHAGPVAPKPSAEPVWDIVLEDGDLLYLPRGWWHMAVTLDEPSLHLTVSTVAGRGVDLLQWLADSLVQRVEFRRDIPTWGDHEAQRHYLGGLRALFDEVLTVDTLDSFRWAREARRLPRPRTNLPYLPSLTPASLTIASRVRLVGARRLAIGPAIAQGTAAFAAGGSRWECAATLMPAIARLRETPTDVASLCHGIEGNPMGPLLELLDALTKKGIVAVVRDPDVEGQPVP